VRVLALSGPGQGVPSSCSGRGRVLVLSSHLLRPLCVKSGPRCPCSPRSPCFPHACLGPPDTHCPGFRVEQAPSLLVLSPAPARGTPHDRAHGLMPGGDCPRRTAPGTGSGSAIAVSPALLSRVWSGGRERDQVAAGISAQTLSEGCPPSPHVPFPAGSCGHKHVHPGKQSRGVAVLPRWLSWGTLCTHPLLWC